MKSCSHCARPLLSDSSDCPFCGVTLSRTWRVLAGAVVLPFVLSACYGGAPCDPQDLDGDTFSECTQDCDDQDPQVNPGATEVCDDGIDNDCDGISASTTTAEVCGNAKDDDCDGQIDERSPDASNREENCYDNLDNDCDGLTDREDADCANEETPPTMGGIGISYTFAGAADCGAAGVQELRVVNAGPSPTDLQLSCTNSIIALDGLPPGTHTVTLSAVSTDGIRTWTSPPTEVVVVAGVSERPTLTLACTSETPGACD